MVRLLLSLLLGKEGVLMIAMFFAQRVILSKTAFKDVPATLKEPVREILTDSGLESLCVE